VTAVSGRPKPEFCPVGTIEVNAPAQGALRQFPQWPWIEKPTFQLGGRHFNTEPLPHKNIYIDFSADHHAAKFHKHKIYEECHRMLSRKNALKALRMVTQVHRNKAVL